MKAATDEAVGAFNWKRISIHAAREGGDSERLSVMLTDVISIHAAREGGDDEVKRCRFDNYISIHAAREGGDA